MYPGEEHFVRKLEKSLYRVKQLSRCLNKAFRECVQKISFTQASADPCVFIVQDKENKQVYLHQGQYIEKMLEKLGQIEAKLVSTPADLNVKLQKEDGVSRPVDAISYHSIAGSLLHAAIATRPDIPQAVGVVSKFRANPTQNHLTAAKQILRYLKGTVSLGLSFKKCAGGNLTGYSDVDWASDVNERRSTSGNPFSLARGVVSWLSKKQATISLSTAEAEYVALGTATQEVIWRSYSQM